MTLLIGTLSMGSILSLLALGVFISFRIFAFPDITADGSVTLGAAVAATLLVHGVSPPLASIAGFFAGMIAGACTGTLHTRFKINPLLSGILVMTALCSVNLHIEFWSRAELTPKAMPSQLPSSTSDRAPSATPVCGVTGIAESERNDALLHGRLVVVAVPSGNLSRNPFG